MTKILNVIADINIIPHYFNITRKKMRVLVSYFYGKALIYKLVYEYREEMIEDLYLDCGAYSAQNDNITLSISEYMKYLLMFGQHFDHTFNLDDDFLNPDHNFNNQVFLENALPEGFRRPIPVIHDSDDPLGEIEIYVDQGHDYIAVGSNKKLSDDTWSKIKAKHPDLKLHMFGNLNRKMLKMHKPYSADAATYAIKAGFGSIFYYHPGEDKEYNVYLGEMENTNDKKLYFSDFKYKKDLEEHLHDEFKFGYEDLLKNSYNKWVVNLHYFRQLEDLVNASK
ncbi:hypothetical protein [Desulfobacula sp.]|uniref:hypothetical protein n=1 Tax=Desulfobacula sp. TaxID=2593537 RepID=UPI001DBF8690|nr:hypothetical protein [Desulfobacula sp.]MBT4507949.1 hypothetical protein [Desulfobacula sp.]